jgi:hypothetical protein
VKEADFESAASTNSATLASKNGTPKGPITTKIGTKIGTKITSGNLPSISSKFKTILKHRQVGFPTPCAQFTNNGFGLGKLFAKGK